jgi:hypothetical protein
MRLRGPRRVTTTLSPPWVSVGFSGLVHGGVMRRYDAFTLLVEIIIMVIVVLVILSIAGVIR